MSMNKGLNATTIVGGFFLSLAVLPAFTSAEVYIGGQVGVTFPQPLSGVERTSGSSVVFSAGTKITDLKLNVRHVWAGLLSGPSAMVRNGGRDSTRIRMSSNKPKH
jgi:hypothetical protein